MIGGKKKNANEQSQTVEIDTDELLASMQESKSFKSPKLNPAQQREQGNTVEAIAPNEETITVAFRFKTPQSKGFIKLKYALQQIVTLIICGYILYFYSQNNGWYSSNYTLASDTPYDILYPIISIALIWKFRNHIRLFGGLPKKTFKVGINKDFIEFRGQRYSRESDDCCFTMETHHKAEHEQRTDRDFKTFYEGRFQYRASFCIYLEHDFKRVLIAEIYTEHAAEEAFNELCRAMDATAYRYF